MQDRADEKARADGFEHERTAVGDALRVDQCRAQIVDRPAIRQKEHVGGGDAASELGDDVRRNATAWKHSHCCEADCDGGIEMATADVAECRDKDEDGQPVRESNRRIMIDPERDCRAGADKDQRQKCL